MGKSIGLLAAGAIVAIICGSSVALSEQSDATRLTGDWRSEPVRLVRGDLEEVYVFSVRLNAAGQNSVMDIEYFSLTTPDRKRLIRQDIRLEAGAANGQSILEGANPRLVSGPEIIGVYEPDSLYCDTAKRRSPDNLSCTWGSPAHGNAPVVELVRQ